MANIFKILPIVLIIYYSTFENVYAQSTDTLQLNKSIFVFESIPFSSAVFVDSVFVGRTPITLSLVKGTIHRIRIQKPGFLPFQCDITSIPSDTLIVNAVLERFSGSVCIFTENNQSSINIDGKEYGKGRIDSLFLYPGTYEVSIIDPTQKRKLSSSFMVEQLKHLSLKAEYNVVSVPRLLYSIILPGYAQIDDKNYLEGIGFTLAGIGSITYALSEYSKYSSAEQDYKLALNDYDLANTEIGSEQARNIADRRHDVYQVKKRRFEISVGVVALVWIGNALDVAFNHLLTDRIEVLSGIYSVNSKQLIFTDYHFTFAIRMQ